MPLQSNVRSKMLGKFKSMGILKSRHNLYCYKLNSTLRRFYAGYMPISLEI